ncbi:hypothetical protein TREMEDRAFT_60701 [Tremella mesenterica DSM 1558]|uniref:uncharacterized protein n=1 Tax=Tremella mesenterica (strain ATCC 24925 / CBS 8224 / DSM 1558 / NBRC 9311 / NRRL Y-6157 / RJB 2259-6 / UBC 559-6) TaxID=578456 RepID=UPI0003F49ED4|nr:uncharacterized protein TREMEDRAFT_60701 [Tremella mesenterica DSM 1558]EIW71786.1 hypothetical protein TREMEDRAFT_60701 [Tremella mesenterica DSM 1558]
MADSQMGSTALMVLAKVQSLLENTEEFELWYYAEKGLSTLVFYMEGDHGESLQFGRAVIANMVNSVKANYKDVTKTDLTQEATLYLREVLDALRLTCENKFPNTLAAQYLTGSDKTPNTSQPKAHFVVTCKMLEKYQTELRKTRVLTELGFTVTQVDLRMWAHMSDNLHWVKKLAEAVKTLRKGLTSDIGSKPTKNGPTHSELFLAICKRTHPELEESAYIMLKSCKSAIFEHLDAKWPVAVKSLRTIRARASIIG